MKTTQYVPPFIDQNPVLASFVLISLFFLLRYALGWRIRLGTHTNPDQKRRRLVFVRNSMFSILALGLFAIWRPELESFALSIVGLAVAMVIATKELILCLSGTVMIRMNGAFSVGDRIEIGGIRGDVIDMNLLATTIIETGPGQLTHQYTGRKVVIPNSQFVGSPFINETFTNDYVLHVFTVPVQLSSDWRALERCLLSAAQRACAPYLSEAKAHLNRIAQVEALNIPPVEVRVTLQLPEPNRLNLVVRLPTPARSKGRIEQVILREAIDCFERCGATSVDETCSDCS